VRIIYRRSHNNIQFIKPRNSELYNNVYGNSTYIVMHGSGDHKFPKLNNIMYVKTQRNNFIVYLRARRLKFVATFLFFGGVAIIYMQIDCILILVLTAIYSTGGDGGDNRVHIRSRINHLKFSHTATVHTHTHTHTQVRTCVYNVYTIYNNRMFDLTEYHNIIIIYV